MLFKLYVKCWKIAVTNFLLSVILFSPLLTFCSNAATSPVKVAVDFSSPAGTSQFSPGISHVDTTLSYPWEDNNLAAVNNAKSLIKRAIPYENTPIMAWGIDDPWPDPSQAEPSDWNSLDNRMRLIIDTGGIPVITLSEAPWWMKGELQSDGTTHLVSESEEWSDIAYSARILDNKMDAWLHLVQRVAERYMVPPYNVRYFQVWNELKGYYNPITNAYDYTTSDGDPGGPNAKHGYTYLYNQTYSRLMQVARSLGIQNQNVQVGGPYVAMDTWSFSHNQSNPSKITKAYGIYDQRPLDVVKYWLQHKAGAGFITVDGDNGNKDGVNDADPFTASEKFADVTQWIRSLDNNIYPGAATLPVWWAEWSAWSFTDTGDDNYNNAIKSYAMVKFLKAGGAVALSWGFMGDGTPGNGLLTTTIKGGGQALPWYYSYKALNDDFAPDTEIYKTTVSPPGSVEALASATTVMLINKTAKSMIVSVNDATLSLGPYQVSVCEVPHV